MKRQVLTETDFVFPSFRIFHSVHPLLRAHVAEEDPEAEPSRGGQHRRRFPGDAPAPSRRLAPPQELHLPTPHPERPRPGRGTAPGAVPQVPREEREEDQGEQQGLKSAQYF